MQLSSYIRDSKSIIALNQFGTYGIPINDHLCAFRCLAVHHGHLTGRLETQTNTLYEQWVRFSADKHLQVPTDPKQYNGLPLNQRAYLEKCIPFA